MKRAFLSRAKRGLVFGGALAAATICAIPSRTAHAGACPPAAGDCTTLVTSGSTGASIDFVIVGDGYTAAEHDKFFQDAQKVADGLLGSELYGAYKPLWNAWALFTPSAESGADDPSAGVAVSTAFDATYDTAGIAQLLAVDDSKVHKEINKRFPEADLVLCLVNALPYGGSGGSVAVISLDASSLEIARHELGHTLANLADEYTAPYPGYPEGDSEPNVAAQAHLDPLKWASWLTPGVAIPTPDGAAAGDHDPVGAFEGARYKSTGIFRPTKSCIMRELDHTFCQVCSEAMVKQFHALSFLIDAPSPASFAVIPAQGVTDFTATIPALADLMFSWTIDGAPTTIATPSFSVDPSALGLADGPHKIALTVYDATPLVRDDPGGLLKESFTWEVKVDSSLPPAGGAGGGGGSTGGAGGAIEDPGCGCRVAEPVSDASFAWLLLGVAPFVLRRRRRGQGP